MSLFDTFSPENKTLWHSGRWNGQKRPRGLSDDEGMGRAVRPFAIVQDQLDLQRTAVWLVSLRAMTVCDLEAVIGKVGNGDVGRLNRHCKGRARSPTSPRRLKSVEQDLVVNLREIGAVVGQLLNRRAVVSDRELIWKLLRNLPTLRPLGGAVRQSFASRSRLYLIPTARRRASALSVRSQMNSGSSRPKWP